MYQPSSTQADFQDLLKWLPGQTMAEGFCRLCPAAALPACSLANHRVALQAVTSQISSLENKRQFYSRHSLAGEWQGHWSSHTTAQHPCCSPAALQGLWVPLRFVLERWGRISEWVCEN